MRLNNSLISLYSKPKEAIKYIIIED